MNTKIINSLLISLMAGALMAFVNLFLIQIAAPITFGISVYFLNYSFSKVVDRNRVVSVGFIYFLLISVIIFIVALGVTSITCQIILTVNFYCAIQDLNLLLMREAVIFFVPWVFVFVFYLRKLIIEFLNKTNG